ncbi:hypothetical protein AB5I41_09030 [Sphingomonas sp. MMS24-JH45]
MLTATSRCYVALDTTTCWRRGFPRPIPNDAQDDVRFENIKQLRVTSSAGDGIIAGTDNAINVTYLARLGSGTAQEAGDDFLFGGDGDDYLYGKTGDDYLEGGEGDDVSVGRRPWRSRTRVAGSTPTTARGRTRRARRRRRRRPVRPRRNGRVACATTRSATATMR